MRRYNYPTKVTDSEREAYREYVGGRQFALMTEDDFITALRRDHAERKLAAKKSFAVWGNVPRRSRMSQDAMDYIADGGEMDLEAESIGDGSPICGSRMAYAFSNSETRNVDDGLADEIGDGTVEHGIVIRPGRQRVVFFSTTFEEYVDLQIELEDEEELADLLTELGIEVQDPPPEEEPWVEIRVMRASGTPGKYYGGPFLEQDKKPDVFKGWTLKRSFAKPKAKVKGPAQQQPKRYEYKCTECGAQVITKKALITDDPSRPVRCEACRKARPIHHHVKAAAQS